MCDVEIIMDSRAYRGVHVTVHGDLLYSGAFVLLLYYLWYFGYIEYRTVAPSL